MKITTKQLRRIIHEELTRSNQNLTIDDGQVWELGERQVGTHWNGDNYDILFTGTYDECVDQGYRWLLNIGFELGDIGTFADEGQFQIDDDRFLEIYEK